MNPRIPARPIIFAAAVALAAAVPALADHKPASICPPGSSLARVALYGQTFEAGFGPQQTRTVIVQHEDRGLTVGNYVPVLACVAPYTKTEQDARNAGLSIPPSNWTPPTVTR